MLIPERVASEFSEWLDPKDLGLCIGLAQAVSETPSLLEIGVWRGGWSIGMLKSLGNARVVGIDPYPGWARPIRREMLSTVKAQGLGGRFDLFQSKHDFDASNPSCEFDLVHIDGNHTEKSVLEDALFAHNNLSQNGIIVFDDHLHPEFPGIRSAIYQFLMQFDYRPFLSTEAKLYVAKAGEASKWYHMLRKELADSHLVTVQLYSGGPDVPPENVQETDVLGQPVLLVLGRSKISSTGSRPESASMNAILRDLLPPLLYRSLKKKSG